MPRMYLFLSRFTSLQSAAFVFSPILEYWNSSVDTTVKKVTALVQGGTGSWEQRKSYYEKIKTVLL